jgi:protein TonB
VLVEATIGADGAVRAAKILRSPSPLLEAAALDAVRQWRYAPTYVNGVAVAVVMTVIANFALK